MFIANFTLDAFSKFRSSCDVSFGSYGKFFFPSITWPCDDLDLYPLSLKSGLQVIGETGHVLMNSRLFRLQFSIAFVTSLLILLLCYFVSLQRRLLTFYARHSL